MSRYSFNAAADLYRDAAHPRLSFGEKDLPRLRAQTRNGLGKKVLDHLRGPATRMAEEVLAVDDLSAHLRSKDRRVTEVRGNAYQLAFVGLLDESDSMLEAGRRCLLASANDGRIDPQGYDLLQPLLTEKERKAVIVTMVKDIKKRAFSRPANYYANAAHNLTFGFSRGGLWAFLAICNDPGAPAMKKEFDELLRRFEATLSTIIHPAGYPEEDIGYGTSVVGAQLLLGEALRRAGLLDPWKSNPGLKQFGQSMLHFVQPWGEAVSNTGDHGSTFANREFSLPRVATETKDPAVLWLAGALEDAYRSFRPDDDVDESPETVRHRGFILQATPGAILALDDIEAQKPVHPKRAKTPTAYSDPDRGIVTFRSSWDEDAAFVVFDGSHRSPACPGHWHDSASHFSLSALGEMFSIDTGRYNNEQDQHSVVIIDGKSGRNKGGQWRGSSHHGQLTQYTPGDFCDFASVDASHQTNCYWSRRSLGLVKGDPDTSYVWIVDDVNKNDDWGEFWFQVQTTPGNTITTTKTGASITGYKHGNHLDLAVCLQPKTAYPKPHTVTFEQDVQSTSSVKYIANPQERAAAYIRSERMAHGPCFVRPRLLAKVAGYNGRFMSILTPRRKGDAKAKVKSLPCVDASFATQVDIGPYRDTIIFAHEHHILEAGDIKARGRWVVVRRDRKTGRVVKWAMNRGLSLEVAGKRLL